MGGWVGYRFGYVYVEVETLSEWEWESEDQWPHVPPFYHRWRSNWSDVHKLSICFHNPVCFTAQACFNKNPGSQNNHIWIHLISLPSFWKADEIIKQFYSNSIFPLCHKFQAKFWKMSLKVSYYICIVAYIFWKILCLKFWR